MNHLDLFSGYGGFTIVAQKLGIKTINFGEIDKYANVVTECERFMGLEDGWTSKGIIDGKEVLISDTQRYKLCGNGVVIPCVEYIYGIIN